MDREPDSLTKQREINFCKLRPDDQVRDAAALLAGIDGVYAATPAGPYALYVRYDVTRITLEVIEQSLTDLGYHLASNLLYKLKRALYYYTEETQRRNLGLQGNCDTCRQIFINHYERRPHGCRDSRPEYWRHYQ